MRGHWCAGLQGPASRAVHAGRSPTCPRLRSAAGRLCRPIAVLQGCYTLAASWAPAPPSVSHPHEQAAAHLLIRLIHSSLSAGINLLAFPSSAGFTVPEPIAFAISMLQQHMGGQPAEPAELSQSMRFLCREHPCNLRHIPELCSREQLLPPCRCVQVCMEGPKEKLDNTAFSQPALYVAGLAAVEKLRAQVLPRSS